MDIYSVKKRDYILCISKVKCKQFLDDKRLGSVVCVRENSVLLQYEACISSNTCYNPSLLYPHNNSVKSSPNCSNAIAFKSFPTKFKREEFKNNVPKTEAGIVFKL